MAEGELRAQILVLSCLLKVAKDQLAENTQLQGALAFKNQAVRLSIAKNEEVIVLIERALKELQDESQTANGRNLGEDQERYVDNLLLKNYGRSLS